MQRYSDITWQKMPNHVQLANTANINSGVAANHSVREPDQAPKATPNIHITYPSARASAHAPGLSKWAVG